MELLRECLAPLRLFQSACELAVLQSKVTELEKKSDLHASRAGADFSRAWYEGTNPGCEEIVFMSTRLATGTVLAIPTAAAAERETTAILMKLWRSRSCNMLCKQSTKVQFALLRAYHSGFDGI